MNQLDLFLKVLQAANLSTPIIVGLLGKIKAGADVGKTEAEIEAECAAFIAETKAITDHDRGDDPS